MANTKCPFSILQISDLHILPKADDSLLGIKTDQYFHMVLEKAFAESHYDLILITGDLAQTPYPTSYIRIQLALRQYQTPCISLPGNHDNYQLMQQLYDNDQMSCKKQFFFKNWQIICLNSQVIGKEHGLLEKDELNFLDRCLSLYPNHPALIAVHHQCIPTHSAWLDTMMIKNHHDLFNMLKKHPQAQAITTGHIHQTVDCHKDSVRIFGTPSTCFQFKPLSESFSLDNNPPGYRHLKLHADGQIETEVKRLKVVQKELEFHSGGY